MKNTKTKGLLLGLAMVAATASVGYASWVITKDDVKEGTGNITAEAVTDGSIGLTLVSNTDAIKYGVTNTSKLAGGLLENSVLEDASLDLVVKFNATGLAAGDTIKFHVEETTNTYDAALGKGLVGNIPSDITLTVNPSANGFNETSSVSNGTISVGAVTNATVTLSFKWGEKFGGKIPEDFYGKNKFDTALDPDAPGYLPTECDTYGEHANTYLAELSKTLTTASYKLTVTAHKASTNA